MQKIGLKIRKKIKIKMWYLCFMDGTCLDKKWQWTEIWKIVVKHEFEAFRRIQFLWMYSLLIVMATKNLKIHIDMLHASYVFADQTCWQLCHQIRKLYAQK